MRAIAWVATVVAQAGCGVEDLGVLSVEFALAPASEAAAAESIDTSGASAWSGSVRLDAVFGVGIVGAVGLPPVAEPFTYRATAGFAADERDSLPGAPAEDEAGHTHGALTSPGRRTGVATGFSDVDLGELAWDATNGLWLLRFFEDDVDDHPLGALRACVVVLTDDSGASAPAALLRGAIGAAPTSGHEH